MKTPKTNRRNRTVFHQLVEFIPRGMIERIALGEKIVAREFSYTSQVLALMLGHFLHAFSLNEICDISYVYAKVLSRTRGFTPPKRNTFSYANRTRDPKVAEHFYWELFRHLTSICPGFSKGVCKGKLAKFRARPIYAIDSSTLSLSLNSIDWARHRTRKAAAKMHMRTDVACMLPRFVTVGSARHHDSTEAAAICEGLKAGDVVIADRGYDDTSFLFRLNARGVYFVVRDKKGMLYKTESPKPADELAKGIVSDERIKLTSARTSQAYPDELRRVNARVLVNGLWREMSFLTNNFEWAASSIAELYKARWSVEILFKELKQTLQLQDFFGENENAVKWQIWTALAVHLLLRFLKFVSKWNGSYSRFCGVIRAAVWRKTDLTALLRFYGTAPPGGILSITGKQPYLPGFEKWFGRVMGQQMP